MNPYQDLDLEPEDQKVPTEKAEPTPRFNSGLTDIISPDDSGRGFEDPEVYAESVHDLYQSIINYEDSDELTDPENRTETLIILENEYWEKFPPDTPEFIKEYVLLIMAYNHRYYCEIIFDVFLENLASGINAVAKQIRLALLSVSTEIMTDQGQIDYLKGSGQYEGNIKHELEDKMYRLADAIRTKASNGEFYSEEAREFVKLTYQYVVNVYPIFLGNSVLPDAMAFKAEFSKPGFRG